MAEDQIVTSIVAKADLSSLVSEVHRATASLQKLQQDLRAAGKTVSSQVKVINNSFGETLRSTGQFSTHFVTLHSDVEKFGRGLDSGRLRLRDYYSAFNQHAKTSGGLVRGLAKQQVMLQNAVMQPLGRNAQGLMQYNVHIPRGLDLVKNKTNLARMELQIMNRAMNEGATALINWGKNTQWAGRQLTVGLTLPLAAFGAAAAKAFKESDQELVRLAKVYGDIGGATADELDRVREDITALSKDLAAGLGVNFKDTIGLAADIAATGKTGKDLITAVSETTRLSVLGEVDRQEAMKATLSIQTAFKQNTEQLAESINFLNAVENQTSTSLNDLVTAIPKAGPVVKALGGDIEDLALYLTAMREGGINAAESANALKSGLASLINPTKQTVGMMQGFGIDVLGMVQRNAGDTTALLLDLQSALDQLDPLAKAQAIEQMFGKFQFARISALLNNLGKEGSQTLQVMELMGASVAELQQVANRELSAMTESASGQYRRSIESLKAELSTLGENFLNVGTKAVNVAAKLLKFLNNLPEPVKKLISAFGGFTAVAGPVIMLTGVLANFAGYIIKGTTSLKALFSGSKGWRLLTPEIVAADYAAKNIKDTFYEDATAAKVLEQALRNLVDEFNVLSNAANTGKISVKPAVSTMSNNLIMSGSSSRQVDPFSPLAGQEDTRAFSHINPRKSGYAGNLMGVVPGAIPVNRKIGATPQIYMNDRLPNIEGLTSVGGVSTGIVAQEAAKFHALMATLGMQTEQEVAELKKVIAMGGTISGDLLATYDDLLPITAKFADKAAMQSSLIVAELRAAKITVDEAKLRIMTLNAQIESQMSAEISTFAASQGRTIDMTKAPLMGQPVTDAAGQFTLRDIFKRSSTKGVMEEFGKLRGIRTYGAPYSIETTRLPKFNVGGQVYQSPNIVPGPNVDSDVVPAMLTPGEFVVNRKATMRNLPLLMAINDQGLGGAVSNNKLNYGNVATDPLFRSSEYDVDLLYRYVDSLMDEQYDSRFRAGAVLNDSMALMQAKAVDNPQSAILRARAMYDEAMNLVRTQGITYSDARDQILLNNPKLKYNSISRQETLNDGIRKAIGDEMRTSGYPLHRNAEFLDRGHIIPRRKISQEGVGYFGQAVPDEFNRFTNSLSARLPEIEDRIPEDFSSARARAAALIRTLGFEDYDDFVSRRSEVDEMVRTGRPVKGRMQPLGMYRFLRPINRNMGGLIPAYGRGGGVAKPGRMFYGDNRPAYLSAADMTNRIPVSKPARGNVFSSFGQGFKETRPLIGTGGGPVDPYMKMNALTMGGSMVGMGAMSMGQSGLGMGIMALSGFLPMMLPKLKSLTQSVKAAGSATTGLSAAFKMLGAALKLTWPILAIAAIAMGIKKLIDLVNEYKREQTLLDGMTEEGAKQAGIKYNNLAESIKAVNEQLAVQRALGKASFESLAPGNVPGISMTIKDMKESKKFAKENLTEFVDTFNTVSKDQVVPLAQNIKAQFIAGGKSAQEATTMIYGIIAASEKANQVVSVLGSSGFTLINDKASSAAFMVKNLVKDLNQYASASDLGNQFSNTLTVVDGIRKGLIGTKDATGNVITETEALAEAMGEIKNINGADVEIGYSKLEQLKRSQPELAKILNSSDTIASTYAKWQLSIAGARVNLQKLSVEQAIQLAEFNAAMVQGMGNLSNSGNTESTFGAIGLGIKKLDKIARSTSAAAQKASMTAQENLKAELALIDKKIKKINEEADAKKKALQSTQNKENYQLEIQQLQLEYQDALSRGDMASAARYQLSIQQLEKQKQTTDAIDAIEEQRQKRLKKQEDEKERLRLRAEKDQKSMQTSQNTAADAAAARDELALQQSEYRRILQAIANAEAMPDDTKRQRSKRTRAINETMGELSNFTNIVKEFTEKGSTTQKNAFKEAFKDLLSDPPIVRRGSPDLSGGVYKDGILIRDLGKAAKKDLEAAENAALLITGGKKLSDLYRLIEKTNATSAETYSRKDPYVLQGKYETKEDGTLTDPARGQIVDRLKLGRGDFFKYGDQLYRVTGSKMNTSRAIMQKADGGPIYGPGTSTSDSIPAYLSDGEYVVRAAAVDHYGVDAMEAINAKKFKHGGVVHPYNKKGKPTGSPYGPRWGELTRDIHGLAYGRDIWGGTEIPGLKFRGNIPNHSDYWHQMQEQPQKPYRGGGGLSLAREPMRMMGSVPFEGLFGGGIGFGGMLTMKVGGYVNPSYSANMSMPSYKNGVKYLYGDTIAKLHKGEAVLPENINPWNPNAKAPNSNALYNINVTLNGSDMDPDDVAKAISKQMKIREAAAGINRRN